MRRAGDPDGWLLVCLAWLDGGVDTAPCLPPVLPPCPPHSALLLPAVFISLMPHQVSGEPSFHLTRYSTRGVSSSFFSTRMPFRSSTSAISPPLA